MVRLLLLGSLSFFPLGCYRTAHSNDAATARIRPEHPDYQPCGLIVVTEIGGGIFASLAAAVVLIPGGLMLRHYLRGVETR